MIRAFAFWLSLLLSGSAIADVFQCGAMIQNKPCNGEGGKKWLVEPKRAKNSEEKEALPEALPTITSDQEKTQPKRVVSLRPISLSSPKVGDFNPSNTYHPYVKRFTGTVERQAPLYLSVEFTIPDRQSYIVYPKLISGHQCLDDKSYEVKTCQITFEVKVPSAITWTYVIKTENRFNSRLVPDLTGCCSWHDGVNRCMPNGDVLCNDGNLSPTCLCPPNTLR